MFGAVHLGVLAACVVLFVPMGMAGWHLSRNKMLFFSCALFITLAVGVHLTPYFPSISSFLTSPVSLPSPSLSVSVNRDSCISLLHGVAFSFRESDNNLSCNQNSTNCNKSWKWIESESFVDCEFQKLSRSDASDLLNGSWVVVAGDSQARLLVVSLLELVMGPENMETVRNDLFKRHSNYRTTLNEIGLKLDFVWAPYLTNLTDLILELKEKRRYPDVLVMGAGLWDMLHVSDSLEYGVSLWSLRNSVVSLLPVTPKVVSDDGPEAGYAPARSPHLFWLGMPMLINSMLNTEEKKERMTYAVQNAYDEELYRSKLLRQSDGPFLLLDIRALSNKCGESCTVDGMHYDGVVYEAAVHILLNALLIESQQKLY